MELNTADTSGLAFPERDMDSFLLVDWCLCASALIRTIKWSIAARISSMPSLHPSVNALSSGALGGNSLRNFTSPGGKGSYSRPSVMSTLIVWNAAEYSREQLDVASLPRLQYEAALLAQCNFVGQA